MSIVISYGPYAIQSVATNPGIGLYPMRGLIRPKVAGDNIGLEATVLVWVRPD